MIEQDAIYPESDQEVIEKAAAALAPLGPDVYRSPLTAAQLALYTGWTMASLDESRPVPTADGPPELELPTVRQVAASERRDVELNRLRHLLVRLADKVECAGSGLPTDVPARLEDLDLTILKALATDEPSTALAYELGRSLRDTVKPPQDMKHAQSRADALERQLARDRIIRLQKSLLSLSVGFPRHAAEIVAASVGRWSEFAAVTVSTTRPRLKRWAKANSREEVATTMYQYLLLQGDLWLVCLIGTLPSGLLTSEGYVAAVDGALHRSSKTLREILRHYWVLLALLAAVTAGVLFLAAANLHGGTKVWTSIATIAGSLGISAKTIERIAASANVLGRLAAEAERPIYTMANEDARTWAITTLPPVQLTARGVRQLRKAGIPATAGLGRV
jgi:hypothetical protein